MTIQTGATKYDAKKAGMVQRYHIDAARYAEGLRRAGAPPGPLTTQAYANSQSYATANYQTAMQGVTGAYWAQRTIEGIGR